MRAAGCAALLLTGVALLPATGGCAGNADIEQLVSRAETAGLTDPEALNRDARHALAALQNKPDVDLEIRTRLLLCNYDSERDLIAAEDQAQRVLALLPGRMIRGCAPVR